MPRLPIHLSLITLSLLPGVALVAGCGASSGCRNASGSSPDWLAAAPVDSSGILRRVGHADRPHRAQAVGAAQRDAIRQLVEQYYGQHVSRQFERVRDQVTTQVTETVSTRSSGRVVGTRVVGSYWQQCSVDGAQRFRASALVEVDEAKFVKAVRESIEASAPMVEARKLERDAARLSGVIQTLADQSKAAGPARAIAAFREAEGHWIALDRATTRYQALLGLRLSQADAGLTAFKRMEQAMVQLRGSLTVGVKAQPLALRTPLSKRLTEWGMHVQNGGCGTGVDLVVSLLAEGAKCAESGMHTTCDRVVNIELLQCRTRTPVSVVAIGGSATRGAGMDPRAALDKSRQKLSQPKNIFAQALFEALHKHLPLAKPSWR